MIHILTMGHLDPDAVGRRQAIVLRPLDMGIVNRLLQELGGRDEQGRPTLDDVPVEIKDGTVACRWLIGGTASTSPKSSPSSSRGRRAAYWPIASIPGSSSRTSSRD
jgi:hypothetical protein